MKIPQVILIEVEHAPGSLSKVLAKVGEADLTVEGLNALHRTQDKTTWELTVEMDDEDQSDLSTRVNALSNARVIGVSDRVFDHHEGGKIRTLSRVAFEDLQVLKDVYTPGVARVCLAIQQQPALARRYTNVHHTVGIVTNGTAVLGLGDIGPLAGLPVMEGKAALFSTFGGLSGVPILIDSTDVERIVDTVVAIAPSFGAIQLEDIAAPACFEIERQLIERLPNTPVLHDDQHGTAVVVLAALQSTARITGIDLANCTIGQIGLGAAGLGIVRLLRSYGVSKVLGSDLSEEARIRLEAIGGLPADIEQVMAEADVVVATTGVRGLIKPQWVRPGQIIFALSNPDPEIEPKLALESGARFAADGKNINNVLAFPGLFRGALDANAASFTDAMLLAAAESISRAAPDGQLIPSPLDHKAHRRVAEEVAMAARAGDQGYKVGVVEPTGTADTEQQTILARLDNDEEFLFKAVSRRNRLLATWAGRKMGKSTTKELHAYRNEVFKSDLLEIGDEDVMHKVAHDLLTVGISAPEVRRKMDALLIQGACQVAAES
jgi:malate dehydrogenase (oxaloacetate-decarboxylating)